MKIKSLLRIVLSVSLAAASLAHAEVRVGADLSPEQRDVLARARASNSRLEWRILTKDARGKPRTVVIIGEQTTTLPKDTMIAKKVIDQFEHFAVEASGPYVDRESEQPASNAQSPMNLPPLGNKVKTIQNAEANYKGDDVAFGYMLGLGYFLMTGYFSANYFFEGFHLRANNTPRVVYNTMMLFTSFVGSIFMLSGMTDANTQGAREKAVADYVNSWIDDPQYAEPVVLIVKREYVAEIERVLVEKHGFVVDDSLDVPRG